MSEQRQTIGIQVHNVWVNISADEPLFLEYAREHLHGLCGSAIAAPDLDVRVHWSEGPWDPEVNPFSVNGDLSVIGKRMLGRKDDLIWLNTLRMKGLQLRFRRQGGRYLFDVAYRFHPRKEKLEKLPMYRYKKFFSLMSYAFYYPLFWYLENFRNWTVIHASALDTAYGGLLIGGLGGVGKTTTCVALMQQAGARLISENVVFTDGQHLFGCYEPIRLTEDSAAMLSDSIGRLRPMHFPEALKDKMLYHFDAAANPAGVRSVALFLPVFSPKRFLQPLPAEVALEKLQAANRLTLELDDYYWYANALDLLWPKVGQSHLRTKLLSMLVQNSQCFELGIDRSAGVDAVVRDVMNVLKEKFLAM